VCLAAGGCAARELPRASAEAGVVDVRSLSEARLYAHAQPEFAGAYQDQGVAVFTFTGDIERHRRAITALVNPGTPILVLSVRYSAAELEAAQQRINTLWSELRAEGILVASAGPDPVTNTVLIGVERLTPAVRAAIRDRFGDIVSVRAEGGRPATPGPPATRMPGVTRIADAEARLIGETMGVVEAPAIQVATNESQFHAYWRQLFGDSPQPRAFSNDEVILFFHVLVEGNCPELVFTGVEVDVPLDLVYGRFVAPPSSRPSCLDFGGSHSFVVEVDRDALPRGPITFRLQREFQLCPDCGRDAEQVTVEL
jgi:hypothetical protein